jgi:hypothetical protein
VADDEDDQTTADEATIDEADEVEDAATSNIRYFILN